MYIIPQIQLSYQKLTMHFIAEMEQQQQQEPEAKSGIVPTLPMATALPPLVAAADITMPSPRSPPLPQTEAESLSTSMGSS